MKSKEKILLIGGNLWYLGEGMLGPLFAVFTQRVGGGIFDITWAWATYLIVTGLLHMVVGKWVDRGIDPAKVMVVGFALNAVCTFGYLLVSNPWHLFLVQIGLGIANALATPTWYALYARYEEKKHDTYEWSLANGSASLITGIAIILGGIIVAEFSFPLLFILMGCIQVLATLYQGRILFIKKPINKRKIANSGTIP